MVHIDTVANISDDVDILIDGERWPHAFRAFLKSAEISFDYYAKQSWLNDDQKCVPDRYFL
jgi:hypothetical protein